MIQNDSAAVDIHCPKCRRWLAEASGYGRSVCRDCGWEVVVRDKAARSGHSQPLAKPDTAR